MEEYIMLFNFCGVPCSLNVQNSAIIWTQDTQDDLEKHNVPVSSKIGSYFLCLSSIAFTALL